MFKVGDKVRFTKDFLEWANDPFTSYDEYYHETDQLSFEEEEHRLIDEYEKETMVVKEVDDVDNTLMLEGTGLWVSFSWIEKVENKKLLEAEEL